MGSMKILFFTSVICLAATRLEAFAPPLCATRQTSFSCLAAQTNDSDGPRSGGLRKVIARRFRKVKKGATAVALAASVWKGSRLPASAAGSAVKQPTTTKVKPSSVVGTIAVLAGGAAVGKRVISKRLLGDNEVEDDEPTVVVPSDGGDEDEELSEARAKAQELVEDVLSKVKEAQEAAFSDLNKLEEALTIVEEVDAKASDETVDSAVEAVEDVTEPPAIEKKQEPSLAELVDALRHVDKEELQMIYGTFDPYANRELPAKFAKAREQPKSPREAAALKKRYDAIESLGERCFAILLDLGLVEPSLNPEDPSYDHSKNDEFCEQTIKQFVPKES